MSPRGQVEASPMQRTGYFRPLDLPLPERPAAMWAGIIDCIEGAVDVEHRQRLAPDVRLLALACRNVLDRCHFHKCHLSAPFSDFNKPLSFFKVSPFRARRPF